MDTTENKEKLFVLLAGQSNMAGRGIAGEDDLTEIPDLLVFRPGNIFKSAVEPVTRDRKFIGAFSSDGKKIETDEFISKMISDLDAKKGVKEYSSKSGSESVFRYPKKLRR